MKILAVHAEFPHFDRTSGGLRLYSLLLLMREEGHDVEYLLTTPKAEKRRLGFADFRKYNDVLASMGIHVHLGDVDGVLRSNVYDAVLFEYFSSAEKYIDSVRLWQRSARVVVDSVDLTYLRWLAKADLTGSPVDCAHALEVQKRELSTYRRVELVLTLTEEETEELRRRIPDISTFVVPNIHRINNTARTESDVPELLFIGSFTHEPNIDAVRYFHDKVWPQILDSMPNTRMIIIGQNPPEDILAMHGDNIEVLGRVPETEPYLSRCWISIAPLRFGAGMKGKIGEAMAAEAPVVTTSFGSQGFNAKNGVELCIADTADEFAKVVLQLLANEKLRRSIAQKGKILIEERFSTKAIFKNIGSLMSCIANCPLKEQFSFLPMRRMLFFAKEAYRRHILWRINRAKTDVPQSL